MDNNIPDNQKEETIDIRRFVLKVLTNWPLFVLCIGLAFPVAFLVNRYSDQTFSVNASILVNEEK